METENLLALIDHLDDNIDDLEESLEPLLATALSATTKKLPVLDKAKLYVLIVYAIESLLFSYLRLNGIATKSHPVFQELTRVKQYFAKIGQAETGPEQDQQPSVKLNKAAAGRVLRHALAGGGDLERAEREARERVLMGKRRVHMRFEEEEEEGPGVRGKKRKVESEEAEEGEISSGGSSSEDGDGDVPEEGEMQVEGPKKSQRRKQKGLKKTKMIADGTWVDRQVEREETNEASTKKKRRKKRKKSGGTEFQDVSSSTPDQVQAGGNNGEGNGKGKSKWVKKAIARKRHEAARAAAGL